jgi:hypothetical protein
LLELRGGTLKISESSALGLDVEIENSIFQVAIGERRLPKMA